MILFQKQRKISSAAQHILWTREIGIIHRQNLNILRKRFRKYFNLFWTKIIKENCLYCSFRRPQNFKNVGNGKRKQICFTKAPRELGITRHVFNANSYANIILLTNLLRFFGYNCYNIVASLWILKNNQCDNFWRTLLGRKTRWRNRIWLSCKC